MKVSVEIPEGKYCGGCRLKSLYEKAEHYQCNVLGFVQTLQYGADGILKHPDCPGLKERAIYPMAEGILTGAKKWIVPEGYTNDLYREIT